MKQITTILSILFFAACSNSINPYKELVVGNWQAISWINAKNETVEQTNTVKFSFDKNGKYIYQNERVKETGSYKVENEMLFTKPENQLEIMVKILKASKDSLVFGMNRNGSEEVLTLIKK